MPRVILSQAEAENSKSYEMALARARQAIFVEKAIGFMNIGSPARYRIQRNSLS